MSRISTSPTPPPATRDMLARLRRTRRLLILGATTRALALGLAAALVIVAAAVFADSVRAIPRALREAVLPIALIAGVVAASVVLWRHRFTASMRRVARWVEEREPRLGFALLTALDADTPQAARGEMEDTVRLVPWEPLVSERLRAALGPPLAAVGILAVLLLISPSASRARVTAPVPGDALDAPRTADAVDPMSPLVVIVTPPPYTRQAAVTLENPSSVAGLAGSTVILRGRAATGGITARLDDAALEVTTRDGRWSATFRMPQRPEALRLKHGATERLLVLEPRIDSVPVVALERPAADTVFATPSGSIDIAATLHDDIGIVSGGLEYIVSSGSGETFSFRSGTLSPVAGGGRARIALTTRIIVDSLRLAAGDVVHLRAFARDANTVTGPSIGYSETRALRIVRADERDSVAVDAAPPPEADASLVSQRMLIILTEALQARRSRMARTDVVAESRRLAADQKKLRRSVGDIIFTRLGTEPDAEHVHGPGDVHDAGDMTPAEVLRAAERANIAGREETLDFQRDESPVVAINRPLLEAYNHMWDAGRELDIGEPGRALPPMRAALAAIQRARQAERIYLRGRAAPVIVDVAAVRLQGKESGAGSERSRRIPLERREEMQRFTRAIDLLERTPEAGIDSLLLLRVDLLADQPAAARPLGESIDLLRSGRDATAALGRARRALLGAPVAVPGLGRWGSPW